MVGRAPPMRSFTESRTAVSKPAAREVAVQRALGDAGGDSDATEGEVVSIGEDGRHAVEHTVGDQRLTSA